MRKETAEVLLANIKEERKKALGNKYRELLPVDTTNLPQVPAGWVWVRMDEIGDALGGFAFKSSDYTVNGYTIIKIGNVKEDGLRLNEKDSRIDNVQDDIIQKYLLRANDLVITLTGTRKKRDYGFLGIVKEEEKLLLNQRVAGIRFSKMINPYFYLLALRSEFFRDQFFEGETGNVGQGNVGMDAIRSGIVPLPAKDEQDKIVEEYDRHLTIADATEKIIDQSLKQAERLRQSILKDAFTGKLVPQDPNDEPAEKLLERIKTEREKSFKNKIQQSRIT